MPRGKVLFFTQLTLVKKAHEAAAHNMLRSNLMLIQNQARVNASNGFKSGAFMTDGWRKITYRMEKDANGRLLGHIGHPDAHFAYWEFGHFNVYTGGYERYQWLYPALISTMPRMAGDATKAAEDALRNYATRTLFRR